MSRTRRRSIDIFNLSFLDVVSCGFGAIILLLVISMVLEPLVIEKKSVDLTGLIISDTYGADIMRPASHHKISPAARKAVHLACARTGAQRLHYLEDPGAHRGVN